MSPRASFSRYQSYTAQKDFQKKVIKVGMFLLLLFLVFSLIQGLFFRTFLVDSEALMPNFKMGDRLVFSPLPIGGRLAPLPVGVPGWRNPERGEVVQIIPPYRKDTWSFLSILSDFTSFFTARQFSLEALVLPDWDKGYALRRVIGLPGDTLYLKDFVLYIKPFGSDFFQTEFELSNLRYDVVSEFSITSSIKSEFPFSGSSEFIILQKDEYWVMADHRIHGGDSRSWGPVTRDRLVSVLAFQYWPWN